VRYNAISSRQHGRMLCTLVFFMPLACAELLQEGYMVVIFTGGLALVVVDTCV
jgi:hypothetical protein